MKEKIAIITYNRIGEGGYRNGRFVCDDKEIFIAQNGHRSKWAAGGGSDEEKRKTRSRAAASVAKQVTLSDMNHIYLYVGATGGEEAIRQTAGILAEKITYVMCNCSSEKKRRMIKEFGNKDAKIVWCECGGRKTLAQIIKQLIS